MVLNSWGLACLASVSEQLYHLHLTNWTLSSLGDIPLPLEEVPPCPGSLSVRLAHYSLNPL